MNRLCTATRGVCNWRDRLADPGRQWRRRYSALETAVAWESAAEETGWLPEPVTRVFDGTLYERPELLVAIAEHKVALDGTGGDSQCDVWALLKTSAGNLSMSVEAKALEAFGSGHETLSTWLNAGKSERSIDNRRARWESIKRNLPTAPDTAYDGVAYQLLHRCAAAVVEARRFQLQHAAFVVQSFGCPDTSFQEFLKLCQAMGLRAERGRMHVSSAGQVRLGIGWADCTNATDEQLAALV